MSGNNKTIGVQHSSVLGSITAEVDNNANTRFFRGPVVMRCASWFEGDHVTAQPHVMNAVVGLSKVAPIEAVKTLCAFHPSLTHGNAVNLIDLAKEIVFR